MTDTTDPSTTISACRTQHEFETSRSVIKSRSCVDPIRRLVTERVGDQPVWVLVTEAFIGLGWIRAAVEKVISPQWWDGDELAGFLTSQSGRALGWYQPFLDIVVAPYLVAVAVVVAVAQIAAGASLLWGKFLPVGLSIGIFLNLSFVAAGAVNPSAFYLLAQGALALWFVEEAVTERSATWLAVASVAGAALAVASVAWIRTIAPRHVVEDPAIMFVTVGVLTVLASEVALSRTRASLDHSDRDHRTVMDTTAYSTSSGFGRRTVLAVLVAAGIVGAAGVANTAIGAATNPSPGVDVDLTDVDLAETGDLADTRRSGRDRHRFDE